VGPDGRRLQQNGVIRADGEREHVSGPAFNASPAWERRNRTKSLWGNVSLVRGFRNALALHYQHCPYFARIYVQAKNFFVFNPVGL